ncbi:thioesterase family protein [Streptomyces varsoviensis]|uniref:acyl-CoA thioesterase n=1 Tax=Streptomyces varsoviensis TaxID=67373 RepID=UPI00340C2F05
MTELPLVSRYAKLLPPDEPDGPFLYATDHVVTWGDTSKVGYLYYSRLIEWQGHLRELFALDFLDEYVRMLLQGHLMLTQSLSCEYLREIDLGDTISERLAVSWVNGPRMLGDFTYHRATPSGEELVARGQQMWVNATPQGHPAPWPPSVLDTCRQLNIDVAEALTA